VIVGGKTSELESTFGIVVLPPDRGIGRREIGDFENTCPS
jgi:hypothetical protein